MNNLPKPPKPVNGDSYAQKSTHMAAISKKHPHGNAKKHPHGGTKKHPHIIPRGEVWDCLSVCSEVEFSSLLKFHHQMEWNTRTKRNGLMALQALMLRSLKNGRVALSLDCSHDYVSAFKRATSPKTIQEPLAVLCKIGIWRKAQKAVNHHVKNSAIYALTSDYEERKRMDVKLLLPPGQKRRLEGAAAQKDKRLNRQHPWRAQLICDQNELGFAPEALYAVSRLLSTTKEAATKRALKAVAEGGHNAPAFDVTGTIRVSLNGIPKELKEMLTIGGEPAAECDISYAHCCFLPVLLRERTEHCAPDQTRAAYINNCRLELARLIADLSDQDFYGRWCDDPTDPNQRAQVKKLTTQLLNMATERAQGIPLYRKMRSEFPCTFAVVEDIKRQQHRTISKKLQRCTADVIEAALLRTQALGIAAIPDTDALYVPQSAREIVSKIIGEELFIATGGVRSKVGGIRYLPNGAGTPALTGAIAA